MELSTGALPGSPGYRSRRAALVQHAIGLSFWVLIPSLGMVQKLLGDKWLPVYVTGGLLLLAAFAWQPAMLRISAIPPKVATPVAVLGLVALTVGFSVGYPIANQGLAGGSDRDEALNLAIGALLSGSYPYYERTYLGNPISPMPGSLLLGLPFFLLGNSSYQNIFWLGAFYFAAGWVLAGTGRALALSAMVLLLSPVVLHEFLTGGDVLANSMFVVCFLLLIVQGIRAGWAPWACALFAALLGIAFSSRANFLFCLPLLWSWMVKWAGPSRGFAYASVSLLAFALVTVPFWTFDPRGFSPLHATGKLTAFDDWLPGASWVVLGMMVVASIMLCWRYTHNSLSNLLVGCAVVQAIPVLALAGLSSAKAGRPDLIGLGFGLSFLFLGALGTWASITSGHVLITPDQRARSGDPEGVSRSWRPT
jgi:hypothetical protein